MASYIGISPPEQTGIVNRFRYDITSSQTAFTGNDANGNSLFYISTNPVLVFMNASFLVQQISIPR